MTGAPLLEVSGLSKLFPVRSGVLQRARGHVHALTDVHVRLQRGQTLGIVGESGGGKSTLAKCIVRLLAPTAGRIEFDGLELADMREPELRSRVRSRVQMIFQDPYSSLNPRQRLQSIVDEPLRVHRRMTGTQRVYRVETVLERVGLDPAFRRRRPHEFSGGQRQRIAIARALVLNPDLIIADEPVSALDVSIQAQIITLLLELQRELKLSYIFISHDLSVVRAIADTVAVMYLGRVMEIVPGERLFGGFAHPYTEALLSAVPVVRGAGQPRPPRIILKGDQPDAADPPPGCVFHTRCPYARERCRLEVPGLRTFGPAADNHSLACHFPISGGGQDPQNGGRT